MRCVQYLFALLILTGHAFGASTTFRYVPALWSQIAAASLPTTANHLVCYDWTESEGITNATKIGWSMDSGASTACSVTIYDAGGANIVRTSGTKNCSSASAPISATGLTAFSLTAGNQYRLCWCNNGTTGGLRSVSGWTSTTGLEVDLHNVFTTHIGRAANDCTAGAAPSSTGSLTADIFLRPPLVLLGTDTP